MNVSNGRSIDLGTSAAAAAAAKLPGMLKAAPMLAAAATLHHYGLRGLMSEPNFSELLHSSQDTESPTATRPLRQTGTSGNHLTFPVPSTSEQAITASGLLAAGEPCQGSGSPEAVICRDRRQAEGTRR